MSYFSRITGLAQLKKQYRKLAIENHPDKGGSTEIMQKINAEFDKLFEIWKHDKSSSANATGYENDYNGASAKEYTEYVYREYRWTGKNYNGQRPPEVVEIIRNWLKETYPHYKFSVRKRDYHCINVDLMKADFEPFREDSKYTYYKELNHYHLEKDTDMTDRAIEVMQNVLNYINSYNFDDSDVMTDYFHVNFYLHIGIGNDLHPYKLEIPKLKAPKGSVMPQFEHPEGKTHKAIRQALGKDKFSLKTAQKRMDKLLAAGIITRATGWNGGFIQFLGYTPETEAGLEQERNDWLEAKKAWDEKHITKKSKDARTEDECIIP